MGLREIQEVDKRERKEKIVKVIIYLGLLSIFVGSIIYCSWNFWCMLLMWIFILSFFLIFGLVAFKKELNFSGPYYKIKAFFARLFLLAFSAGGLTLFLWLGVYNYFLDIPDYINQNYKSVAGTVEIKTTYTNTRVKKSITINGIKLVNLQMLPDNYNGTFLVVYYLPHSNYVIHYMIPKR